MNTSPLFMGFSEQELQQMRDSCMHGRSYEKGCVIFRTGDVIREIGIVQAGSVNIESIDLWGSRSILSNVGRGQVFGETYAMCGEPMMVDVVAAENSEILFLRLDILMDENQPWYGRIMSNMLRVSVQKNLELSSRIFFTTPKTIRGRLLAYLSAMSVKCGSTTFQVPFDRQQMADYLNLDRSALSKELGKMRDEGLIEFYKNTFRLNADSKRFCSPV